MRLSVGEYISQTNTSRRPSIIWLLSVGLMLSIVACIVGAPIALASSHIKLGLTIYQAFSTFCHQLPERSFFIGGYPFAVCARCTGLYCGFTLLLMLYPIVRPLRSASVPSPKWLYLAAAPLFIDFSLTFLGIWQNTHTSRLLTGLLLGGVAVFYVMPGLVELALRREQRPKANDTSSFTFASPEAIAAAPSDYSAPERRI
jgi:uncharacterized membrane protein